MTGPVVSAKSADELNRLQMHALGVPYPVHLTAIQLTSGKVLVVNRVDDAPTIIR